MQVILISSDDEPDGEEALGATAGESTGSKNNINLEVLVRTLLCRVAVVIFLNLASFRQ